MVLIVLSIVFFMFWMVCNCFSSWLRIHYKAARVSGLHQLILNVRFWP